MKRRRLLNSLTIYLALALVAVLAVSCGSSASPTTAPRGFGDRRTGGFVGCS